MTHDETLEDDNLEILATDYHDEDAALIIQFEDALMETIQSDAELSIFYASYQDASSVSLIDGSQEDFGQSSEALTKVARKVLGKERRESNRWHNESRIPTAESATSVGIGKMNAQNVTRPMQFFSISELYDCPDILCDCGGNSGGTAAFAVRAISTK